MFYKIKINHYEFIYYQYKLVLAILILFAGVGQCLADEKSKLIEEADITIKQFLIEDPSLQNFFDESYGYVVMPTIGKGGFIFGGAHGDGILYKSGKPVGHTEMKQVTVGAQVGGKSFSEIIFFKTEAEFNVFTTGRYEVTAQVSAVAITTGTASNLAYSEGVAIVTLDKKGLMAEAVVGGQKFTFVEF